MGDTGKEPITADLLEEISGTQLNERLVSLQAFICKICKKILTPPIMLVKDLGNICGTCTSVDDSSILVHNYAVEEILENLIIPCRNKLNGCEEKLNYWHILKHESICDYRNYSCPLSLCNACTWVGSLSSLKNHFLQEHGDNLLFESDNYFRFNVDISKDSEIIKLLCNKNYNFVLRVNCDLEELKLKCIVYYITKKEQVPDFLYSIELEHCGITSNKCDNVVFQDMDLPTLFDTHRSINIDLRFAKNISDKNETVVSTLIKIIKETDSSKENPDEKLLRVFECPVCNYFMKPPIPLCLNGHSVCNICKPKLKQCPICRTQFGTGRNYALEHLSSDVSFPCIYRDQGCYMVLTGPEMVKHELQCKSQMYPCPVPVCQWKTVNWSGVVDHLLLHHSRETICSNYHLKVLTLLDKIDVYYMAAYDCIFRVFNVISLRKQCICWMVEPIIPRNAGKFKYEIGFIDNTNKDKRFLQTRTCNTTDQFSISDDAVKIMLTTLRLFSKGDRYITYCKITKLLETDEKKLSSVSEEHSAF